MTNDGIYEFIKEHRVVHAKSSTSIEAYIITINTESDYDYKIRVLVNNKVAYWGEGWEYKQGEMSWIPVHGYTLIPANRLVKIKYGQNRV